jgi:competence protein ComEA
VIASPATPDLSDINPVYTPPPDTPAPNPNPTAAAAPTPATSSDADSGDTPQAPAPGNYIDGKLNINAATLDELVTLPGIGETLAKRIIDYRSSHGDFAKISDVTKVSGIGAAKYEAIQELITVN